MTVIAAILPVIGRSSRLALQLYHFAATLKDDAAKDLVQVARGINDFSSILKQVGTIIKEDDRLPSHEVIHSIFVVICLLEQYWDKVCLTER